MVHADDLVLKSASCVKLLAMLTMCEEFGMLLDLKYNVITSCSGCVGRSRPERGVQFVLENRVLPWVEKNSYLGITFNIKHEFQADCSVGKKISCHRFYV